jgi:hypothetical protein
MESRDVRGWSHSIWLAEDHLLLVQSSYFTQTASRVDLRDIEAIVVRPTATYAWTNALAAMPCLLGTCLIVAGSAPWVIFGALLTAACLLVLLVNLLRGRTCECRLQTRVSTRTLYALRRYRDARRALAQLAPRLEASQADLPAVSDALAAQPAAAAPADFTAPAPPARHVLHAIFFGLLAVQSLALLLVLRATSTATLLAGLACAMLLAAVALLTAGYQHRVPVATRLRLVTWLATGGTLFAWIGGYLVFWFTILNEGLVETGFSFDNQLDRLAMRFLRQMGTDGLPAPVYWLLLVCAMAAALLAVLGFAVYLTAPPVPAAPLARPSSPSPAAAPPREVP